MLQYLTILLNDNSVSFCSYEQRELSRWISLDTLHNGILFAMKENLNIQFVYPAEPLPAGYEDVIEGIDHTKIKPKTEHCNDADVVVFNNWQVLVDFKSFQQGVTYIVRTSIFDFLDNYLLLYNALKDSERVDVIFTDAEKMNEAQSKRYGKALTALSSIVKQCYKEEHTINFNLLTDRLNPSKNYNCGAGETSLTLAPDGKFYVCPAFYGVESIGDLESGIHIPNQQLYKLAYAPICRECDAWQCPRCVWLNRKTTLEVNTPSHEQCVKAHIERNASRDLLAAIRKHGEFMPDVEIQEIDYMDPFDKLKK